MNSEKVVIVFGTRLNLGFDDELAAVGAQMYELASGMPGFLSYKDFAAEDGEYASIIEFASMAELAAWRNHPEHLAAQKAGREKYFCTFQIQVCTIEREYSGGTQS